MRGSEGERGVWTEGQEFKKRDGDQVVRRRVCPSLAPGPRVRFCLRCRSVYAQETKEQRLLVGKRAERGTAFPESLREKDALMHQIPISRTWTQIPSENGRTETRDRRTDEYKKVHIVPESRSVSVHQIKQLQPFGPDPRPDGELVLQTLRPFVPVFRGRCPLLSCPNRDRSRVHRPGPRRLTGFVHMEEREVKNTSRETSLSASDEPPGSSSYQ